MKMLDVCLVLESELRWLHFTNNFSLTTSH